ncbi:MAG: SelB C-terminal domain-containing protein, partial [Chloroflexi bacterium]|nr:SelB C-terminal domain-containing protein [Chloroflexota bacterium]
FTIAGFGTVVTGTLIDGRLRVGDEVEILPEGLRARVRGLQTHKAKVELAIPPSRVAVNLVGVSKDQLQRGDVLTTPGWLRPTSVLDARLRLLKDAPRPLVHNKVVDFFTGTAQCEARVRLLDRKELAPGEESWAQFILSAPIAVVKGDRFIIRQASPSLTLGGGMVVDPFPQRRHRRFQADVLTRLEQLTHGTPDEILLQELEREQPCEAATLVSHSTLGTEQAAQTLRTLLKNGQVVLLDTTAEFDSAPTSTKYVMSLSAWETLLERMIALLREYHQRYPLRAGMPREELKSRLHVPARAFNDIVAKAAMQGVIRATETVLLLADHQVVFTAEQQRQVNQLLQAFQKNPYSPPSLAESEALVGAEVLAALIEQGKLVKVSDTVLFSAEAYQKMVQAVVAHLQREGRITLAQVRDMFSTSRKYAQALLEHLDDKRITKRIGDERILR